jgi:aspartate carbamoyltransferase catalytic subunit
MSRAESTKDELKSFDEDVIWERQHILDLDDFTTDEIDTVLNTTKAMKEVLERDVKKVPILRGKTVLNMFYEPSTRTRASFEIAGKILSADVVSVSSGSSSSVKGESLIDTGLTLRAASADVIVLRHPQAGSPYLLARHLSNVSIINAGDGCHAHPTQGLLDLYTILSNVGRISGIKVAIIGDVAHSRVARSDMLGLAKMGAKVTLCGPKTLIPMDMLRGDKSSGSEAFNNVVVESDINLAMESADVVIALRIQKERFNNSLVPSLREYASQWQINKERLKVAKKDVLLMHPGPVNEGVEISPELVHGDQSVIEEQVRNGVAVRMALLYLVCTSTRDE